MATNKVVFGDETIIDLTDASEILPSDLRDGKVCYDRTGEKITGNAGVVVSPVLYESSIKKDNSYFSTSTPASGQTPEGLDESFVFKVRGKSDYTIRYGNETNNDLDKYRPFAYEGAPVVRWSGNKGYAQVGDGSYVNVYFDETIVLNEKAYLNYNASSGGGIMPRTVSGSGNPSWTYTFVAINDNDPTDVVTFTQTLTFTDTSTGFTGLTDSDKNIIGIRFPGKDRFFVTDSNNLHNNGYTFYFGEWTTTSYPGTTKMGYKYFRDYTWYNVVIDVDKYVRFDIDSNNSFAFMASLYSNNTLVNTLTLKSSTAEQGSTGYPLGVDILDITYLSTDAFFIMYNHLNNDEQTRTKTYGRILYVKQDGTLGMTDARDMFAASLAKWNCDKAGSIFSGRIFAADFKEGAEWKIGIQYIRDSITSANVNNGRYAYAGIINFYASSSASRIMLQTNSASKIAQIGSSCVPSTGANVWFGDTNGNIVNCYNMTSASVRSLITWMMRVSANAESKSDTPSVITSDSTNSNTPLDPNVTYNVLGRLEDGNYVLWYKDASDNNKIKIMFYNIKFTTSGSKSQWTLINTVDTIQSENLRMLKNNVIIDVENKNLYQIMFNTTNNTYVISSIGKCEYTKLGYSFTTGTTARPHIALPTGQYSSLFDGIGGTDIVAYN